MLFFLCRRRNRICEGKAEILDPLDQTLILVTNVTISPSTMVRNESYSAADTFEDGEMMQLSFG